MGPKQQTLVQHPEPSYPTTIFAVTHPLSTVLWQCILRFGVMEHCSMLLRPMAPRANMDINRYSRPATHGHMREPTQLDHPGIDDVACRDHCVWDTTMRTVGAKRDDISI